MKSVVKRMFVICMSIIVSISAYNASGAPKREFRSTWLATVWALDWPSTSGTSTSVRNAQKAQMQQYLDDLKSTGLTGICFQVRPMADALYKSSYEPWSSNVSGTRGVDPGWDPLAFVVEECHKRGLECYAWVNPYRWSTGTDYNTTFDKEFKNKGLLLTYGKTTIFNPGLAEARTHILNVCKEIINNYAVDGMLFDDYFYPEGIPSTSDAPDYALYQSSGTNKSIGDWRRANVNLLIKNVYDMIQANRPDVRFGVGPAGIAGADAIKAHGVESPASSVKSSGYQYSGIFSDPLAWLEEGTIDFISPQIYWTTTHSTAPYEPLTDWWTRMAHKFGRHHYASQTLNTITSNNTTSGWAEIAAQVQCNRDYVKDNACGSIYYSAKSINGKGGQSGGYEGLGNYLKANKYTSRSLVPVITWKDHTTYSAPANASISGSTMKWDAVNNGKAIIRYSIYAVPENVKVEDAQAADGDGFDARYLVDVSYSPSYTLPADKSQGYWYAVCVYDGYGYESAPALIGYKVEDPIEEGENQFTHEKDYKILTDGVTREPIGGIDFNCLWVRSSADSYKNMQFESNGTLNRGMVASGDYVYISGRSAASTSATLYLDKYSSETGEYIGRIILSDNGKIGYLPCNDVIKDSEGNILISNLSLNASTTPIVIHKVDIETGQLTQVCSLTYTDSEGKRIDHVAVFGDVDSGSFSVFGAFASTKKVVRWVYSDGQLKSSSVVTLASLVPSSATSFGIAPRIMPINKKSFYVSGSNTVISQYSFTSGELTDSFSDASLYSKTANAANGGCVFFFEGNYFMVYPATDHSGANGATFNFVSIGEDKSMADAMLIETLPKGGLGKVNSTTCSAPCDYIDRGNGVLDFYTYSVGNGIAAYRLNSLAMTADENEKTTTGIENLRDDFISPAIMVNGRTIHIDNCPANANVQIFAANGTIQGKVVSSNETVLRSPGVYVVKINNTVKKVIVR